MPTATAQVQLSRDRHRSADFISAAPAPPSGIRVRIGRVDELKSTGEFRDSQSFKEMVRNTGEQLCGRARALILELELAGGAATDLSLQCAVIRQRVSGGGVLLKVPCPALPL